jgi:hypothetical protein
VLRQLALSAIIACAPTGAQIVAAKSAHSEYLQYPAFGDRVPVPDGRRVEMAHDKGLIVELTVRCGAQVGIITYSKVDRAYCTPTHRCWSDLNRAVQQTCGSRAE